MATTQTYVGTAQRRVDGPLKVTGAAKYAGEYKAPDLLHGRVVSSAIAHGTIERIDTSKALAVPGVVRIFTHENRRRTAWFDSKYQDQVAPPGSPFRPLYDKTIHYSGQPIALVVADSFETARHAASLIEIEYRLESHQTDLAVEEQRAYVPPKKRSGIDPPPDDRGDFAKAFAAAKYQVQADYYHGAQHHNPMEPHASTVVWNDGKLTVYDKIQGVQNGQQYITSVFGLSADDVQVVSPFVGGAFGSGLRPQYQLFLAVMAALELKRSVRVTLSRDQMFTFTHRPETRQTMSLGADENGKLVALRHAAVAGTSTFEDYQEVVVNWSGLAYHCDNVSFEYKLAKLHTYTPGDMRAPGAPTGMFALESAIDELAEKAGVDPLEFRIRNYAEKDLNEDKPFSSKELMACYRQGAERFGWSKRQPAPRSMREGRELIGYGMATGIWEAQMQEATARATVQADGKVEVATATSDIGTGTYTILAQLAADGVGVPIEDVTVKIADSSLPKSPLEGGSWTAASVGSAVVLACQTLRQQLFEHARGMENSPLANEALERIEFRNGRLAVQNDPSRSLSIGEVLRAAGVGQLVAEEKSTPDPKVQKSHARYTHIAVFAEVRVDEELGLVRATRLVGAVAAGRILNLNTARSQIIGGLVFGQAMALEEHSEMDHHFGRFMNHNIAEYHIPVNADIHEIDVIFVEEHDVMASPIGVKGVGEIGIVGTAAAIANAVHHATGKRVRDLPITMDKVMPELDGPVAPMNASMTSAQI
ncbi:MAG TPA: xanthine dehydrogenase family protein molybdopterin-binding subunit [Geminicoccus sp.]|jgi:xanthine dehydrogenase YagR molybdenum-binding subunit|uniref:xanthine dehydrogenase family protein molybdopterin-binding subunit n=1 Tax=Geminicoccus sp. TaxID=2024832 RepID=UPI002E30C94D|nr:xanthine dehydrogenase family protein molybdopterin-binding subunit [Geminicoccus sp.]HEX2526144.1 xanthine dehydrogenase family protein molybdopterin-binding subunit [Geminicoccus sp.]